ASAGPADGGRQVHALRVIARGSHITIIVDDAWAGEAVDDSFRLGHIAFAAQNYGPGGGDAGRTAGVPGSSTRAVLETCMLDSRPLSVETWYYRWNYYILPEPAARRRLAETFFAMGEHLAAAIQLRKLERRRALDADELFLKAEISLRLEDHEEAAAALDACLALDPARRDAAEEKANLLYLSGDYAGLREALAPLLEGQPDNARLQGLLGHARFALGDFEGAAAAYRSAAELDAEQPLFRMNEARAWDQAKRRTEAIEAYLAAARLFFRDEADDDLSLALGRLIALKARGTEVRELRAKVLFRQGRREEAAKLLAELVAKGSTDSAIHYLHGIILAGKGDRARALERFTAALELEPDYPLYAFRYAESLFLLEQAAAGGKAGPSGHECPDRAKVDAAIERALELAPADGWVLNLAGQAALERGEAEAARAHLEAARAALPGAPEPAINLAELETRSGRLEEALAILAPFPENAACRNQAGNVLSRQAGLGEEGLQAAAREYERACALDPTRAEYQANLAAVYLEQERYSDAEARIRAALDLGSDARTCLLAGNLALVYGDRPRAEASYRVGLELSPSDPALLMAMGRHWVAGKQTRKAEEIRKRLEAVDAERAARLGAEIEDMSTEGLSCASCGRSWRVPRKLPVQSEASIRAMPPDESPAGACPRCGKIYCIACRKGLLVDNRFTCPVCGESLKLSDDRLRYLVREHLRTAAT
ncbi:MAG TPA: tetratricopeptide repeat protein, partial [Rectinemataceae bacterium]|nr:tetratricopeptide repeat protein [Rectinemataceae bacterium]